MSRGGFIFTVLLTAGLVAAPAFAQSENINGIVVPPGKSGEGQAQAFEGAWNPDGDFACKTGSPVLIVSCQTGNCRGREVTIFFEVTGGDTKNCDPGEQPPCYSVPHTFDYAVDGTSGTVMHTLAADGDLPQSIDSGTFVFNLNNGDQLTVTTQERVTRVPSLELWGGIVAVVAFLGASLLLFRRFARPVAPPAA